MKQNRFNLFTEFNLSDFKKWMNNQKENSEKPNLVGTNVESKVSLKKLIDHMKTEHSHEEIAQDFIDNGGLISAVKGHKFLIEVEAGDFLLHRMYVKRMD